MTFVMDILNSWLPGKVSALERVASTTGRVWLVTAASRRKYILKEQLAHLLEPEQKVLFCLYRQKLPVAPPLPALNGSRHVVKESRCYCLYPVLPGSAVSDHYTPGAEKRAEIFGEAIGRLHRALAKCDDPAYPVSELEAMVLEWAVPLIESRAADLGLKHPAGIGTRFRERYSPLAGLLPRQLTHGDLHPGNMLYRDGRVSGYLDFEIVARRVRIYDPVYCAAVMLIIDFRDRDKRRRWFDLLSAVLAGYRRRINLTEAEYRSVFPVLLAALIFMIAFHCGDSGEAALANARYLASVLSWLETQEQAINSLFP